MVFWLTVHINVEMSNKMSQYLLYNPSSLFNQNSEMSFFLINDKVSVVKHAKYSLNGWNGMSLNQFFKRRCIPFLNNLLKHFLNPEISDFLVGELSSLLLPMIY